MTTEIALGTYVLATKYHDGDPKDEWCVGFYSGFYDHFGHIRHLVARADGIQFRRNGFRRVARIADDRGSWMVRNIAVIELMSDRFSVWHWYRAPWSELKQRTEVEA